MKVDLTSLGLCWELDSNVATWHSSLPIQAATALNEFLVDHSELLQERSFSVPAEVVATWSETAAMQLGAPANCPLAFDVRLSGAMGKPGAQINVRWLQPGKTVTARDVTADGLWLNYQGKAYRINSPIYEVLGLVDRFNQTKDASIEEQFRLWAGIRSALGDSGADQLTDSFLRSFRVITASALTFSIRTDARGDVNSTPSF